MLYSRSLHSFTHEPPVLARLEPHSCCQDPRAHKACTCMMYRLIRALVVTYISRRRCSACQVYESLDPMFYFSFT